MIAKKKIIIIWTLPSKKNYLDPLHFFLSFLSANKNIFDRQNKKKFGPHHLKLFVDRQKKIVLVLLSASVERFSVSGMRDFVLSFLLINRESAGKLGRGE